MSSFSVKLTNLFSSLWNPGAYEQQVADEAQSMNEYIKGMSRNNPFYAAASKSYRKGVVGTGFNIQSKTYNDKFDKEFEHYIRRWSRRGNCEITGRMFFEEAQRIMTDEYSVKSGGFIISHHYSKNYKYGYKFEILPLQLIDTSKHNTLENIYNGIEINKSGEIVAIWLFTETSTVLTRSKRVSYKDLTNPKYGLTMRQKGLGRLDWIPDDLNPKKGGKNN